MARAGSHQPEEPDDPRHQDQLNGLDTHGGAEPDPKQRAGNGAKDAVPEEAAGRDVVHAGRDQVSLDPFGPPGRSIDRRRRSQRW